MACAMIQNQQIATVILDQQRTTTEFLTPFRNSQSEKQHFFATKCCGNSSRFLAKVLRKLRRSPGVLLPDFSPCTVTIQRVRDLERFRAIDLLPKLRTKISDFVLPDFTRKLEFSVSCSEIPMEMAPSVPRTRAAAALRMKQIALDNQERTIRRLRAQLATKRRGLAATKKELEETQVALEASHKVIAGLTKIGLSMSKKIEKMKVKKQQVRANHVECHQKFQARIHEAEDSMQAQHLIIEALVDEKDSLLQTIHGLQEANNAPAPFDGGRNSAVDGARVKRRRFVEPAVARSDLRDKNEEHVEEEEQDQFWGW
ncbi:hypothetical protein F511_37166 [Dorcoceras hygrometricum]|uniref:Uncharacterized protein n=1 Tax=Dorcoceras hygrometricum TaxID=472368 RepID=A0A2Z7BGK7_9LAMI|nr:hypothetical protein F511_37166 [Dorcoceras hygrometricum]